MTYSESMKSLVALQLTRAFTDIQAAVSTDCKSNGMCREFRLSTESMTYCWGSCCEHAEASLSLFLAQGQCGFPSPGRKEQSWSLEPRLGRGVQYAFRYYR
jgi:hypothetical protein